MADQLLQERNVYCDAFSITPADATVLPPTWGGLWIGGAGNVTVTTKDGTIVTFTGVPAGTHLPIVVKRVRTATTATDILGMR